MKTVNFIFIVLFLISCGDARRRNHQTGTFVHQNPVTSDSVPQKISGKKSLKSIPIVAGKAVGRFKIGDEVDKSHIVEQLGEADSADAAMCKSWSMWYWNKGTRELDMYAVCNPDADMRKTIKIIRLKGFNFQVINADKIDAKATLSILQQEFPTGKMIDKRQPEPVKAFSYFEDSNKGIGFELTAEDKIRTVLIFPAGESLANQYVPWGGIR